jgi:penicillin amidase
MTWFKKVLIAVLVVIVLVITGGAVYLRILANRGVPDYNRDVIIEGVKDTVAVYRDQFAVPHVYAQNEEDLYRAVGYVMAQDRLWQMDFLRRITTGQLSEIFGKETVDYDHLMRALRMSDKSRLMLSQCGPALIKAVEAFSDGVNQFIEQNRDNLPLEFSLLGYEPEEWLPVHSLNLVGHMAWGLTQPWSSEILVHLLGEKLGPKSKKFMEMLPDISRHSITVCPDFSSSPKPGKTSKVGLHDTLLAQDHIPSIPGLAVFDASNNWAVSGEKSVTGKPLFANDMHLQLFVPGIWYQMHQVIEGNGEDKLNVTGVVLPGQPLIVSGHNNYIAWGMTNVMVDDMDFYNESINPQNPNQYRFNGQWKDMEVRGEVIKIKGGASVEKVIRFTHRGPVISEFKGVKDRAISMRWIGNDFSNEFRSVYLLNRARNWEEFREAVRTFIAVSQNIAYADTAGNIGMQVCAGVPIRKGDGITVAPGDTGEYDWKGIVPFDELPYSFNPANGYVSSANNKSVNDDYPYYISRWFAVPDRIERIREMLEQKEKLSMDDFKQMHADVKSKHVRRCLGDIAAVLKQSGDLSGDEKEALDILSGWDGVMAKENPGAIIFENLFLVMVKNLVRDELGDDLYRKYLGKKTLVRDLFFNTWKNKDSQWCDNVETEAKETFDDWIRISFKETVGLLKSREGGKPSDWRWGRRHKLLLMHPIGRVKVLNFVFNFNRGPFPIGGSFHTVCPYSYSLRNPFVSDYGASQRHIYDTSDWDESFSIIPTGTSGIPSSPHYCDQTKLYIENKYHRDFFSKTSVINHAVYAMKITGKNKGK